MPPTFKYRADGDGVTEQIWSDRLRVEACVFCATEQGDMAVAVGWVERSETHQFRRNAHPQPFFYGAV
jgi:hypothetical protein